MGTDALTGALRETIAQFDPSGRPRTTTEVADDLDLGRRSTYNRLERLVEHERLETKKVGANGRVWWRPPATASATPDWSAAAESLVDDVLEDVEVGIFVLDENFTVAWINETTERYFGLDSARTIGRDKRRLLDEHIQSVMDDSGRFAETVLATYDDNTYTEQFECHVTAGEGREERWLEHRSRPIESGAYAGGRVELYYDVTESRRAREEHQLQLSVSRSIAEAASLEKGLRSVMEHVCEWTNWEIGQAWTPTEDGVAERLSPSYAESEGFARFNEASLDFTFDPGVGIPGRVLESGEPVWFPDVSALSEEEYHRASLAAEAGVKAGLGVPVLVGGEVALILEFYMSQARRQDDWMIQVISSIAAELGTLVARKQAEDELERQRDLMENVLETSPVGIGVLDDQGSILQANARIEDLLELTASEIEGRTYDDPRWDIWDEDGDPIGPNEHPVTEVIETGKPVLGFRHGITLSDGTERWLSSNASPILDETGEVQQMVVALEDITDLKEKERQLARQRNELEYELEDVFERIDDGFFALDTELRFTYVNERAADFLGRAEECLLSTPIWEALEPGPKAERVFDEVLDTQESTTFEEYYEPLDTWFKNHVYPSESGLSVYIQDITERKEREQQLRESRQRYQTLVENFPNGIVALFDEDLKYRLLGGSRVEKFGLQATELKGEPVAATVEDDALSEKVRSHYRSVFDGENVEFEIEKGGRVRWMQALPVTDDDGEIFAGMVMSQDITERKERERELYNANMQLEAAMEAGAIGTWEWHIPDDRLVADASLAKMFEMTPEEAREGVALDRLVSAIHEEDRERVQRAIDGATNSSEDYQEEFRVQNTDGEFRWVLARGHVECDDEGDPVTFPGAVVDITERKHAEQKLERQHEQLSAINGLNEVVRDITAAVIDQSTREEIEETVCDRLAATDSYLFAWVGEVDPTSQTVALRTEAGIEGYLDEITISVDPDDIRSEGATGRAFKTGDIQVTQDIRTDTRYNPWRDDIGQYGFRSSAAVPITHEDTIYGVLNVYADRPYAFEGQEKKVISQLGEVVGHAIAAAERKQALLSDELVELDFEIRDVFAAVDAPVETGGTITLDHVVPVGDREFLIYGTATQNALDTVYGLVDVLSHWDSVTVISDDEPIRFELRMSDPPVLSAVASRGGYIDEAVIEDGDYRMRIHLAPSVDVRQVTDAVESAYPQAQLFRRHQISQSHEEFPTLQRRLGTDLTDRQRSALEAAFHAGFFEWPRKTTGEEIAESLGIASPTFHQHLRKAQQKTFDALMAVPIPSTSA